jgi:hypothetical protein
MSAIVTGAVPGIAIRQRRLAAARDFAARRQSRQCPYRRPPPARANQPLGSIRGPRWAGCRHSRSRPSTFRGRLGIVFRLRQLPWRLAV